VLRDYEYTENWRLLDAAIELFIDLPPRLSLVGFSALTPDSFLWKIFDGEAVYFLYAEDYVHSLDHVREQVAHFALPGTTFDFIPTKKPVAFEDSSPNQLAETYAPPKDEYEFSKFASQSGYDFVFLLRSNEQL
jgi:hypothetical protein